MFKRNLEIGGLKISPPLFLAPMAGLTHSALRQLILDFGPVGLLSTEMLSASSLPHENSEHSPYLIRTQREKPISYQLLVFKVDQVERAVEKLLSLGADCIDINLGCGAPKVVKKGGGVALSHDPERLKDIVKAIKALCNLPVTVKIRLGPTPDVASFKDRCLFLQDLGIDALYVHARFDKEPFARPPKWEMAAEAKRVLSIPVIVNGGIFNSEDAKKCLDVTGADGLMIGRGAAIRPWIFRDLASKVYQFEVSNFELPDLSVVWMNFFHYLESLFPPERRIGRLKEFTHYFSQNYAFGNRLAMAVQRSKTMEEAKLRAIEFFMKNKNEHQVNKYE